MHRIVIIVFFILYFLCPPIWGIDLSLLFLLIPYAWSYIESKKFIKVPVSAQFFLLLNISAIVLLSLIAVIHMKFTPVHLLKPYRIIVMFFLLLQIFGHYKVSFNQIRQIILYSALINSVFIYLQYLSPLFGYEELSNFGSTFDMARSTPYRKSGLLSGFPTAGILSLFGFLCVTMRARQPYRWYNYVQILLLCC